MLISQLESHLRKIYISHSNLSQLIKELPSENVKQGTLQNFLAEGSLLTEIPGGRQSRPSSAVVYKRCVQIKKEIFSNEVILALDKGKHGILHYIGVAMGARRPTPL